MAAALQAKYGPQLGAKIVVLPPRVNLERFSRAKRTWSVGSPSKVVMVGAVNENKGQRRLIDAVLPAFDDVEIWIVGDGPGKAACAEAARFYGGMDRVKFYGRLTHDQLSELLPQADIFVMFSRNEGTPRALMEAMVVGLPVITTNAGFCADVVESGRSGIVLGNAPQAEVCDALKSLLADQKLREEMGSAAREQAMQNFDSVILFPRYRELIREVAAVQPCTLGG
jgi:glycosyltransferase involved in cell wall biosynthesis